MNYESSLANIFGHIDRSATKDIQLSNDLKLLLTEFRETEEGNKFFERVKILSSVEIEFNDPARIIGKFILEKMPDGNFVELMNILQRSLIYTKQFKGIYYRNGHLIPNYVFYDEREWSYIPPINLLYAFINPIPEGFNHYVKSVLKILDEYKIHSYLKELFDEAKNRPLNMFHSTLSFDLDDISYIIVDNEADVDELINEIDKDFIICGEAYKKSDNMLKITRKIRSYAEIKADFSAN